MKLNKDSKDYYQNLYKETVTMLEKEKRRPSLFLHACCGPCLTYPLSILLDYFDVTVGFFNPNIQPEEEYQKRLATLKEFLSSYAKDRGVQIPLIINEDDFLKYNSLFRDRFKDHEGGNTCLRCHSYRMGLAYEYAYMHHYEYFTTVMTVSCKKPSRELNLIAMELAKKYPDTKYLYSDFKKDDGQLKGILLAKKYNLYRQDYCGCIPSLLERQAYKKRKEEELSQKKA